ncbi:hypothetical protein CK203_100125 [Vitis vinifera]|uniref:Uncharacterized protein n=1 Tax=Vitis vinifera TaxID=29760 RepID=A0A438C7J2_VITVI|nr:hypothetical protein CK203_100125 [Vitis vinifera]
MAPNLRVNFKERQRKRHFEALLTTPLPAKKTPPKRGHLPDGCITLGGNANERDAPISSLDWEEIGALLKVVPCFIAPEPPVSSVNAFFPLTRHHFVKLFGDPCLAGVVRPSHGTLESALQCTYPMQKYTAEETSEMNLPVLTPKAHLVGFSFMLGLAICGSLSARLCNCYYSIAPVRFHGRLAITSGPDLSHDDLCAMQPCAPHDGVKGDKSSTTENCTLWTIGRLGRVARHLLKRSTELPGSTKIHLTSKSLVPKVRIRASSWGCNTQLWSTGGKVITPSIRCVPPGGKPGPQALPTLLKAITVRKCAYPSLIVHSPKRPWRTQGELMDADNR